MELDPKMLEKTHRVYEAASKRIEVVRSIKILKPKEKKAMSRSIMSRADEGADYLFDRAKRPENKILRKK